MIGDRIAQQQATAKLQEIEYRTCITSGVLLMSAIDIGVSADGNIINRSWSMGQHARPISEKEMREGRHGTLTGAQMRDLTAAFSVFERIPDQLGWERPQDGLLLRYGNRTFTYTFKPDPQIDDAVDLLRRIADALPSND